MAAISSLRSPLSSRFLQNPSSQFLIPSRSSYWLPGNPRAFCCSASPSSDSTEGRRWESFRKKKVVMRVGYIGTDYKGLQMQRHDSTSSSGSEETEGTGEEESGGGSHDVAPPGESSARREGKAPAFEVRRREPGSAAPVSGHSLGDPEEVRSLLSALVTHDFASTLGSGSRRDLRRLQDAGVVETLSGLLKTVMSQRRGASPGATSAGSSVSAGRQRSGRHAEAAAAEAAALRAELARERRRREAAVRQLEEAGLQEGPLTGSGSEQSESGDQEGSQSEDGESERESAGGQEETSAGGDESERSSTGASED